MHTAYNLAVCYIVTEKPNKAEIEIAEFIDCDPTSADGPCLLSTIQLNSENFHSAEKNAQRAIELGCDKCIVANKNLAFALKAQGKLAEATEHFIKYMNASGPSCISGHKVLIELLGGEAADDQT